MGLTTSIVRIIKIAGDTIGAGFILTDDGLIATCAHVVANAGVRPGETVKIVFHYTGEERQAVVEAEWWRKPEAEDVAILRLIGELPEPVKPLPLGTSAGAASHPFETMGFPPTNPTGGILGSGMILGQTKINEMLVLQLRSQEVTGGFSGAPVWDCITRRVVGMVTATADPDGRWRLAETAFITPTETLHQVCPDLQLADICPYRGLTAFTESDAKFFFGRETLVSSLVTHLRQNPRFLAVVGPSGSGKSSLVQAGLVPALRQGRLPESSAWYIITFRPGSNPFVALPDAGPYFSLENELELTIQQFFDSHQDVKRLVLFIDQFEELFALCSEPVQDQFMSKLSTLLKSSLPITVILTLRADFYGYLLHHNSLIEWLKIGQVNVPPISATDLQAIIEEPAKQVGLRFEPGLVDIITAEASQIDQPLPLLESMLTQLWERREDVIMTHGAYQAIGKVAGAIGQWAEDTYTRLNADEKRLAQRVFTRLVHFGGGEAADTRHQRKLVELVTSSDEENVIHQLVRRLASDKRLLVTDGSLATGEGKVEIIHDALLREWKRLYHWISEQREFYLWRQRLDERLREWQQDKGELLHGVTLSEAEHWFAEKSGELSKTEWAYIQQSLSLREQEQKAEMRRRRSILIASAITALIFSILALVGFWQRNIAQRENRIFLAQSLASTASSIIERTNNSELAALLVIEALRINNREGGTLQSLIDSTLREILTKPYFKTSLTGHEFGVNSLAFSPDGSLLASASSDRTIRLWKLHDLTQPPTVLTGKSLEVLSLAFSPDGRTLAGGYLSGVQLWHLDDLTAPPQDLSGCEGRIDSITFSPDRNTLAASTYPVSYPSSVRPSGTFCVWDLQDLMSPPLRLIQHENEVLSIAFSPDGQRLASASYKIIQLWDVQNPSSTPITLTGHDSWIRSVTFSPDGQMLASASDDRTVRLWRLRDLISAPLTLTGHKSSVRSVAFSHNGLLLASGSSDHTIRLWNLSDLTTPPTVLTGHNLGINSVAFNPNELLLASTGMDRVIHLWDLDYVKASPITVTDPEDQVNSVAYSPDGTLAMAKDDQTIQLVHLSNLEATPTILSGPKDRIRSVAFSPDGVTIAATSDDQSVYLWDLNDLATVHALRVSEISVLSGEPNGDPLIFHPNGHLLASGALEHYIYLWDLRNLDVPPNILTGPNHPYNTNWVSSLAFSPNGVTLVSGNSDGPIELWDWNNPTVPPIILTGHTLDKHQKGVWSVAFSPDGETLASAGGDQTIHLWDMNDLSRDPIILANQETTANSIIFSPDRSVLASGNNDGTIRMWDLNDLTAPPTIVTAFDNSIEALAFSPDGTSLAAVSSDGSVQIWIARIDILVDMACQQVHRNLTKIEWSIYLPGESYHKSCPNLPGSEE